MEHTLRTATWVSAGMLFTGLMLWLAGVPAAQPVLHGGLWLLISTPIVRVVMALAAYLGERDWRFFALTLIVLACLIFPLVRYFLSIPR